MTITELEEWERLIYDACTLCGRCTLACPMGVDIAELVKEARYGMFKAGLVPDRLQLMDRAARAWTSPATPAEDIADIMREVGEQHGVEMQIDLEKADHLVTVAPAELTDHTKALADIAKILNRIGASWTYRRIGPSITTSMTASGTSSLDGTRSQRAASDGSPTRKCSGTSACSVYNASKLDCRREPCGEISRKAGCLRRARPV